VREEVERLSGEQSQDVDLSDLIAGIVESARLLASERGIGIRLCDEVPGLRVAVNRVMLRQALINLLSHIVRSQEGGQVPVRIHRADSCALIEFTCCSMRSATPRPEDPYAVAGQLFAALGLQWTRSESEGGLTRITVSIPLVREHGVLVIDDNEGLITLLRRYLRGQPYQVHGATDAQRAMQMVEQLCPDIIILDVMMPGRDGWEVLQALRATEPGKRARIIVCSIIDDPQLSAALGADAFLHKPVDKARLLRALGRGT
jgi:CheY-like chemotaxis protein